jgi:catechol 2,3-dioxygenase-like lactoylglutathione lyase family enzyme
MKPELESVQPVLMSRDVVKSIRFYQRLGFVLAGQDSPTDPKYARVQRDSVELHLQWHDAIEWDYPNDRPTYRFLVLEVDELYREFSESDALSDATPLMDTPWGTREFHLRDPDANGLQFYRWS